MCRIPFIYLTDPTKLNKKESPSEDKSHLESGTKYSWKAEGGRILGGREEDERERRNRIRYVGDTGERPGGPQNHAWRGGYADPPIKLSIQNCYCLKEL